MIRALLLLIATSLVVAVPSTAVAIPDPTTSTVDPCLIICPLGDFTFNVTVRDPASNPVANSTVQIDFCPTPSVHLCLVPPCTVSGITNAAGAVSFSIRGGGISATPVTIRADGVLLGTRPVASPDQDGNQTVNGADQAIGNGKLGAADPTMDLDCDQGVVDAQDLAVQQAHLGHTCSGPTPAKPGTWGRIKTIYR